jgi:DNA-binding GntR family transcriptional regulator
MINKFSSVPLYNQLIDILLQKINNGEYNPGDKIPSEQDLCEEYDISRPTVRQAIKELVQKGILIKLKGKGTFLLESDKKIVVENLTGFEYSVLDSDNLYERKIISVAEKKIKSEKILELFKPYDNKFCEICFEMCFKDTVYGYGCSLVNLQHFPNLVSDINSKKPSYEILKAKYPYLPVKSVNSITIDYASSDDSTQLHIPQGKPLIKQTSTLYSRSGFVVEVITCTYIAELTELRFEYNK